jgi:hypothetical protein
MFIVLGPTKAYGDPTISARFNHHFATGAGGEAGDDWYGAGATLSSEIATNKGSTAARATDGTNSER